jgi:hypothetical protein
MKNVQFTVVALAIFCLVGIAMTRESVPPNEDGPILARPCYAPFPTTACAMCNQNVFTSTSGTPPNDCNCPYVNVTNQPGYQALPVSSGGKHGPINGDGSPSVLCHFEKKLCVNGICVDPFVIFHMYAINTAAEGTDCTADTNPQ